VSEEGTSGAPSSDYGALVSRLHAAGTEVKEAADISGVRAAKFTIRSGTGSS